MSRAISHVVHVKAVADDDIPRRKVACEHHFPNRNGLAGTRIEVGAGPALRTLPGGADLGVGDHDAVGIGRAGDFAFELGQSGVQQQRGVGVVDDGVALPVAERHLPAAQPKLGLRLGESHFSGRDLVLQRLGHADHEVNRRAQLVYPVCQHAFLAQRSRKRNDRADGQRRQRNHAREFGADLPSAEQIHIDLC
jgi:hypothetical protein